MHGSMITNLNPEIVTDLFLYGQDMEALYDCQRKSTPRQVHYFIKNDEKDQFEQLTKAVREADSCRPNSSQRQQFHESG